MLRFLDAWISLARRIARPAARAGGLLLLAAAVLVAADVVLRGAFLITLGGADELSGYAFAIATTWGLALVLLDRANVRVDALYVRLPAWLRALLDVVALAALSGFVALLAHRAGLVLEDTIAFGSRATTPLATPLVIPQSLWLAGFALYLFAAVPLTLRAAIALAAGDVAAVQRLAGARSIAEDAASEAGRAP